jgi:hypothetical protein
MGMDTIVHQRILFCDIEDTGRYGPRSWGRYCGLGCPESLALYEQSVAAPEHDHRYCNETEDSVWELIRLQLLLDLCYEARPRMGPVM